ncbi:Dynein assembly factor with WDR repeat domains 1 [Chionoecetes opilio]|uniref:Dynein assembly factor with WDR repeat domains 1 n=1 Tax=Chionoecetes opilio TaxID=41210 RepID=A0A8J5CKQ4_CHIOP|nr:Dynein assembly factor with WDR repeat domains 1 [Chionoecetes opilio]
MEDFPANHPDKVIRKLRKKLRQIDHLDLLDRELNEEEEHKVSPKPPRPRLRRGPQWSIEANLGHAGLELMISASRSIPPQSESDIKKVKKTNAPHSCQTTPSKAPHTEAAAATDSPQPDPPQEHCPPQQTLGRDQAKTDSKSGTSKKSSKHKGDDELPAAKCRWTDGCFEVLTLQGHNDIVLAVDCSEDYILSASRDTTLRVWRVGSTEEERSLRGHTASVTALSFLPQSLADAVVAKLEDDSEEFACQQERTSSHCRMLAVSGSLDCTLKVSKNDVYAGSLNGELGVWHLDPGRKILTTKYIMERESLPRVSLSRLSAVVEHRGKCYLGDGGPNIKVLDWKKSQVSRLKNHSGDVGLTDSVTVTPDGCLLAASFLVDSGCPSINIRDIQSGQYLSSLIDQDEGRYLSLCAASDVIVAGGHLLKVWIHKERSVRPSSVHEIVLPVFLHKLATPAVDSGSEEDTDWASSSEEEDGSQQSLSSMGRNQEDARWWCSVL